jgi:hypothetical protein
MGVTAGSREVPGRKPLTRATTMTMMIIMMIMIMMIIIIIITGKFHRFYGTFS